MEESNQVTFSCLANDFVPNIFEFKWLKNGKVVKNASLEFTTPSTAVSSDDGTRFSAASFLTLPKETLVDDTRMTCEFSLQRGAKKQQVESVLEYRTRECSTQEGFDMKIIPPSWEDLLLKRNGEVRCEVTFPKASLVSREVNLSWRDEKMGVLMTPTDPGAQINGKRIILPLDITFEEWNSGVRRTCLLDHGELLEPLKRVYERKDVVKSLKPPSIFMLPPLKQTREGVVTLTCYIKDFYPKELYVSWLIDDKDATHDFRTTGSMEANGAFEAYSRLSVPLSEWDVPERAYSCLVHHESVEQNKSYVRSITQNSPQQTTMVNLNMRISDRCKAQ
uniref:Ig-like domain-containing protein n=1 Tax=Knipowitschia caucasica TaxID=637954 RepID=A0AAV2KHP9_KNICA